MDFIKFLGTAGARIVVTKQLRASGGIWLNLDETNILIDPGPGTLVKCISSKPKLNPSHLDGIILTHKHLDHSNDINIMIEAMTEGGFKKKGKLFAPSDAFKDDPVILKYVREYVKKIEILEEKGKYSIGNIQFTTPVKHVHSVETYGLVIFGSKIKISLIADTLYFNGLENYYEGEILILNTVRLEPKSNLKYDIQHLTIPDTHKIISYIKPKLAILTHFGMTLLKAKPWEIAQKLSSELGIKVIAANDGMQINLSEF
ncbi:MBL fold metallo-hydrolase [Candidatus Aminicenantes bacterium AH-873-B07]|jgi:ribonuclease BN (tRNA processing enzyme)|nr:MBL fold metallo-hydrolase [Candidatus Aminicenantes bacterium AH-873-B07]